MGGGKCCVFAPIIAFFVVLGALIFGLIGYIIKRVKKGYDSSWTGVVQDKKYVEKKSSDFDSDIERTEHFYNLVIKLDNGEVHTLSVKPDFYNNVQVGDKLRKEKHKMWPEKI